MDFKKLNESVVESATEGAWMEVRHPHTGEVIGEDEGRRARIKFAGPQSIVYRDAIRRQTDKRFSKVRRAGRIKIPTQAELDEMAFEMYAACTLEWENIEMDQGPIPCSQAQALAFYKEMGLWLKEQMDEHFNDPTNYAPVAAPAGPNGEEVEAAEIRPQALSSPAAYEAEVEKKQSDGANGGFASRSAVQTGRTSLNS